MDPRIQVRRYKVRFVGLCLTAALGGGGGPGSAAPLADADGDGYIAPADCHDRDPAVHPGAVDACNGLDDDCDGTLDAGCSCPLPGVGAGPRVLASTYGEPFSAAWGPDRGFAAMPFVNATALQRVDRFGRLRFEAAPLNWFLAQDVAFAGDGLGIVSTSEFVRTDHIGRAVGPWATFCTPDPEHACAGPARIAWASDRFGIAWFMTGPASEPLRFRTFDSAGAPIGPPLSPGLPRGDRLALAASADVFAVVFGDALSLHVWTVRRSDLATYGPTEIFRAGADAGLATPPAIVWNGGSFGVAWSFEAAGERTLHLREVSPEAVAGPLRTVVGLPQAVSGSGDLALTWAADRYAVSYGEIAGWFSRQFFLATFDRTGQVIAHATLPIAMLKPGSGLEWTGMGFVWLVQDDAWNREVMTYAVGDACTADADGDGWSACVDGDDADPGVWTAAGEVRRLDVTKEPGGTRLSWTGEWAGGGGPVSFDITDTPGRRLRLDEGYAAAACAASGLAGTSWLDVRAGPVPGEVRCYLVRPRNRLGPGTYGEGGTFPDPRDALDSGGPCS